MKITQATLAFTLLATGAAADESATKSKGVGRRQLRALQDDSFSLPTEAIETAPVEYECNQPEAWHRDTSMGWVDGTCVFNVDCEETSYASEGECCDGAYANQWSKACLKNMPDYEEAADVAELAVAECDKPEAWHRDTSMGWANGLCVFNVNCNEISYATQGECCDGAYANQWSEACIKDMPEAERLVTSTIAEGAELDVWWPDWPTPFENAACTNKAPLPRGEPTYATMFECCSNVYATQASGTCVAMAQAAGEAVGDAVGNVIGALGA